MLFKSICNVVFFYIELSYSTHAKTLSSISAKDKVCIELTEFNKLNDVSVIPDDKLDNVSFSPDNECMQSLNSLFIEDMTEYDYNKYEYLRAKELKINIPMNSVIPKNFSISLARLVKSKKLCNTFNIANIMNVSANFKISESDKNKFLSADIILNKTLGPDHYFILIFAFLENPEHIIHSKYISIQGTTISCENIKNAPSNLLSNYFEQRLKIDFINWIRKNSFIDWEDPNLISKSILKNVFVAYKINEITGKIEMIVSQVDKRLINIHLIRPIIDENKIKCYNAGHSYILYEENENNDDCIIVGSFIYKGTINIEISNDICNYYDVEYYHNIELFFAYGVNKKTKKIEIFTLWLNKIPFIIESHRIPYSIVSLSVLHKQGLYIIYGIDATHNVPVIITAIYEGKPFKHELALHILNKYLEISKDDFNLLSIKSQKLFILYAKGKSNDVYKLISVFYNGFPVADELGNKIFNKYIETYKKIDNLNIINIYAGELDIFISGNQQEFEKYIKNQHKFLSDITLYPLVSFLNNELVETELNECDINRYTKFLKNYMIKHIQYGGLYIIYGEPMLGIGNTSKKSYKKYELLDMFFNNKQVDLKIANAIWSKYIVKYKNYENYVKQYKKYQEYKSDKSYFKQIKQHFKLGKLDYVGIQKKSKSDEYTL